MRLIAKLFYASAQVYGVSFEQWNQRVSPSISLLGRDGYGGRVDLIPKTATEYVSIRLITCCPSDSLKTAGIFFRSRKHSHSPALLYLTPCASYGLMRHSIFNDLVPRQADLCPLTVCLWTTSLDIIAFNAIRPTPSSDGSAVVNWYRW